MQASHIMPLITMQYIDQLFYNYPLHDQDQWKIVARSQHGLDDHNQLLTL